SDLYSVGVILYELLTGAVPFEGETAVAIAFKQVSATPRPPSELNPALPASLDAAVLRALAKDPVERYADAGELIAALEHERRALPAFAGAAAPSTADGHGAYAPPPVGAPPGAGLLMAPAGGFGEDYGPSPESRRRRRRSLLWALAVALAAGLAALALVLTSSHGRVTVPDVAGETEQAAGAALRRAGLNPVPSLASSAVVATGLVISQTPPAGSVVERGTRVTVVVSGGPASEALVGVEGLTGAQAVARLRTAGFKPTTRAQPSATVAPGRVIATEPPAGTELQLASHVTVLVSSGPEAVHVPDVVGQLQTAAEATLTNAGLAVGAVTKQSSATQSPGTVLSQSPATGTSVHAGGKVDLVVAQAPTEVSVPNVVGQDEALAAAALGQAGLIPKTASATTTEPAQAGVVLQQSPAAGAHARKGSRVTITVGVLGTPTTPTTPTTTTPTTTTTTPPPLAPPAAGG
ncbi:MAG TPA: PASTA domain-containing protein, partial [Solirubrobacteraceae bacterium]|nr:PASTA domain-containing protein [Solirubrobacteraceae bacterium]